jgi:hypothetical protein
LDRAVDVCFGGEVVQHIATLHDFAHGSRVGDVAANELAARIVAYQAQVFEVAGVSELVEDDDASVRLLAEQHLDEVAADEAGATGDQDPGHAITFCRGSRGAAAAPAVRGFYAPKPS